VLFKRSAGVRFGEYVIAMSAGVKQLVFDTRNFSGKTLKSADKLSPLWMFRKTKEVAAAATFVESRPRRVS